MIELIHIQKSFSLPNAIVHPVKDLSLTIHTGELLCVIGKSGAGKSTLLRCINVLERPDSGDVFIDHHNVLTQTKKQLRMTRHSIGMVFQHFNLLSRKTVFDNVAYPLRLLKKSSDDIKRIVDHLLEEVGLFSHKNAYPDQLSGGQKQRVAIARALATSPTILLCDEITSALDPHTTADILQLLKKLQKEYALTIVFVTHEMSIVRSIADRVAIMHEGELIACGTLDALKTTEHALALQFLAEVTARSCNCCTCGEV
jgi:D-methionine transport system ATP-binding protein